MSGMQSVRSNRTVVRLAQSKPVTTDLPILSVIAEEVINAKGGGPD